MLIKQNRRLLIACFLCISVHLTVFIRCEQETCSAESKCKDAGPQTEESASHMLSHEHLELDTLTNEATLKNLLKNPKEVVLRYASCPYEDTQNTHAIPLTVAALVTGGPMLEFGPGVHSTSILHKVSVEQQRLLVSVEEYRDWYARFEPYSSETHTLLLIRNQSEYAQYGADKHWSLVFIDHGDLKNRYREVIRFANNADVVIAHDTEKQNEELYMYSKNKITSYYKYWCKYSIYLDKKRETYTSTTLLSNVNNLEQIVSIIKRVPTAFGIEICNDNM